ncbi:MULTISPECIES: hypothetical protein [unclassified Treponema]|uniref:hypothetical protein n=1 Tax=unclassified Treponema TaxID=2638727 RepID=UPI0025CFC98C|nr:MULTISPECIES: hypothetical protein [unclassified Treponema]
MTSQVMPQNCPKFTLHLKSHTRRKRIAEAKSTLASLYPFEVNEKKLLILKTDIKWQYDVYLLKEEIKRELNIKKLCLAILPGIFILAVLTLAIRYAALKNTESLKAQKELEKQKQDEERIQKEKEEKLAQLKKTYNEKKHLEYEKIYPCIERIYSAMAEKTATIENISIQKNAFTVEATAKDAVSILANFEKSRTFTSVKMNRTTVKNGAEIVSYNGEFSRLWKETDEKSSLDKKIEFYETELLKMQSQAEEKQGITLSEYIKNIRNIMHKNSCNEQYIQIKGKSGNAEIEFFVLSGSKGILNFIREIQEGDENLIDIKSFALRNSENRSRIQTTVCFDTGIKFKQNDALLSEYTDKKIDLSEIDRIFYKAPSAKTTIKTESAKNRTTAAKSNEQNSPAGIKKLTYIGRTKLNGKDFVIAKDDGMGSIYKISLAKTESVGDFCIQTGYGYRAKLRGEYYEVKK